MKRAAGLGRHMGMHKGMFAGLLAVSLVVPVSGWAPQTFASVLNAWTIDSGHSAARFSVKHMMVSTVRGTLGKVSGTIEYDGNTVESIKADVTIDVTGVNTDNDSRDKDLKSDSFFDIKKYPTVTFKSKRVQPDGQGRFKMIGDLAIHGVTKEVTLNVEGPSPALKQGPTLRVGASATTTINRRDWGLQYNKMIEAAPIVGDDVQIQIDVEATKRG
jgi:polyisoprenoid-binding protein YceI